MKIDLPPGYHIIYVDQNYHITKDDGEDFQIISSSKDLYEIAKFAERLCNLQNFA